MAANSPPKVRGFFASTFRFRDKVLLAWDFVFAVVAAVLAWVLVEDADLAIASAGMGPAALGLAAALVGVVVASLALVVAFLDEDLLVLVAVATEDKGSIEGQLFPYWFVAGTGTGAVIASTALLLISDALGVLVAHVLLSVTVGLLVWTAVGVFNLVAYLHHLGVSRATLVLRRRQATRGPEKRG